MKSYFPIKITIFTLILLLIGTFFSYDAYALTRHEKDIFFSEDFFGPVLRDSNLKIETIIKGLDFPTQIIFIDKKKESSFPIKLFL